jgi:hypothetical protein
VAWRAQQASQKERWHLTRQAALLPYRFAWLLHLAWLPYRSAALQAQPHQEIPRHWLAPHSHRLARYDQGRKQPGMPEDYPQSLAWSP